MSEAKREHPLKLASPPSSNGPTASSSNLSDRVRSLRLPQDAKGQATLGSYLPWIACLLLGGLAGYAVYQSHATAASLEGLQSNLGDLVKKAQGNGAGAQPTLLGGRHGEGTGPGVPTNAVVLASKGYIVAFKKTQVSPKVGGTLTFLDFKEGQRVKKGHVLAKIETVDFQADYDRTVANAKSAEQRYMETKLGWPIEVAQAKAEFAEAEALRDQYFLTAK